VEGGRCCSTALLLLLAGVCIDAKTRYLAYMRNEFTAILERDGDWWIAYSPEVPGANGQGRSKDEARESLAEAIRLILELRREEALRGVPDDAVRETVVVA
jgi:predicted RNase H-like HicB family nuclease